MGTLLRLKDGKREFIGTDRHFSDAVRTYMGDDAAEWFDDRVHDADEELKEAVDTSQEKRHTIEEYVLHRLIPSLTYKLKSDADDSEEWAEDFKAVMEDVYGLDE